MEVDKMKEYKVNKISEIDIRTGHCVIDVEGIAEHLTGKIVDPAFEQPDNIYTSSLISMLDSWLMLRQCGRTALSSVYTSVTPRN